MSYTFIGGLISLLSYMRYEIWRLITFLPTVIFAYLHIKNDMSGKYVLYAYLIHIAIWGTWRIVSWICSTLIRTGRAAAAEEAKAHPRENKNPYSDGRK